MFIPLNRWMFKRQIKGKDLSWVVKELKERKYSGVLEVASQGEMGYIYFDHGQLVGSHIGGFDGLDAIMRLFSENEGNYRLRDGVLRQEKIVDLPQKDLDEEMIERRRKILKLRNDVIEHPMAVTIHVQSLGESILKGIQMRESKRKILRIIRKNGSLTEYIDTHSSKNDQLWEDLYSLKEEGYIFISLSEESHSLS
jgi:hypothetical protein